MKTGYFITARLKSSRLKQKILLDLNGTTVLDRVIERAKKVNGVDDVVLCTSTNSQDSVLYDNALRKQIKFYHGSEQDVLKRLLDAAKYYNIDGFLSITADNPLHSFYAGSLIVDYVKKHDFDFVFTKGLPVGIAPYYIKTKALEVAVAMKEKSDTEIWGPFVNRPDFFNIGDIEIKNFKIDSTFRLTCDYPDDYALFRRIYSQFHPDHAPTIFEVEDLFEAQPSLAEVNKGMSQQSVDESVLGQIKGQFDDNWNYGLSKAKEIGLELKPQSKQITIEL